MGRYLGVEDEVDKDEGSDVSREVDSTLDIADESRKGTDGLRNPDRHPPFRRPTTDTGHGALWAGSRRPPKRYASYLPSSGQSTSCISRCLAHHSRWWATAIGHTPVVTSRKLAAEYPGGTLSPNDRRVSLEERPRLLPDPGAG